MAPIVRVRPSAGGEYVTSKRVRHTNTPLIASLDPVLAAQWLMRACATTLARDTSHRCGSTDATPTSSAAVQLSMSACGGAARAETPSGMCPTGSKSA